MTSPNNERLGVCTGEVNKATKNLGVASRNAVEFEVKKDPMIEKMASLNRIQLMKLDREEVEKINKAEKDLEIAYRKLKTMRQDAYKGADGKSKQEATVVGFGRGARVPT